MTTLFPNGIDTFVNPVATDALNSGTVPHTSQHDNLNDAVLAIETLLGVNATKILPNVAGKNAIINGGMDIWQRGTSNTNTISTSNFGSDRWQCYSGVAGRTVTQQPSGLTGFRYCLRFQRDSGNAVATVNYLAQNLETVNSIPLAGQTVTLSFWARAGANYSATSNLLGVQLRSGTGTDENTVTGAYTGLVNVISQNATLTTLWQRFTFTATVGATATELAPIFYATPTGTAGVNDYFEITGIQLELSSTATTFSRAGGSIGGETVLCQRYLPAFSADLQTFLASTINTTATLVAMKFPTTARVAPTGITISSLSHFQTGNSSQSYGTPTAISFDAAGKDMGSVSVSTTAGSPTLTAGQTAVLRLINPGGYILFTGCEL